MLGDRVGADEWDVALLGAEPARATTMDFTSPYSELRVTYLAHAGVSGWQGVRNPKGGPRSA